MILSVRPMVLIALLLSCVYKPSTSSVTKAEASAPLCADGQSNCLIFDQSSDGTVLGHYWVQGNHVYSMLNCGTGHEAAKALSGHRAAIQRTQSEIQATDFLNNPFLSCPSEGNSQVDERFHLDDVIFRLTTQGAYLVPFH
ncbi:MAG: hypothetical protein EOP04_24725, partial [Proteobacteria bacterium]